MPLETGKVHVYTGDGKGKTTAALGLGLRATGAGLRVCMIQFMKGNPYGELKAVKHLPTYKITQFGREEFVSKDDPDPIDIHYAQEGFKYAKKVITAGTHDLVILDEINVALDYNLLSLDKVLGLIEQKPAHVELVLTGRYASPKLVKIADIVTEMLEIKHPFHQGILGRQGIDY